MRDDRYLVDDLGEDSGEAEDKVDVGQRGDPAAKELDKEQSFDKVVSKIDVAIWCGVYI